MAENEEMLERAKEVGGVGPKLVIYMRSCQKKAQKN